MSTAGVIIWNEIPDVLTAKQLAFTLDISERSARRLCEEHGGKKILSKWYLPKQRLIELFED